MSMTARSSLSRRIVAEAIGTALLLATVVGSGVMGERLAGGNVAIALLANTIATGAGLVALILTFGPITGAHFNPAVTLADASQGGARLARCARLPRRSNRRRLRRRQRARTSCSVSRSSPPRSTCAADRLSSFSEFVATFGLLAVIWGCGRAAPGSRPVRRRRVHHRRLLVHLVHLVREPRGDPRARGQRHLRRHSPGGRAGLHRRAVCGAAASTALFRWLVPTLADGRDPRRRSTFRGEI